MGNVVCVDQAETPKGIKIDSLGNNDNSNRNSKFNKIGLSKSKFKENNKEVKGSYDINSQKNSVTPLNEGKTSLGAAPVDFIQVTNAEIKSPFSHTNKTNTNQALAPDKNLSNIGLIDVKLLEDLAATGKDLTKLNKSKNNNSTDISNHNENQNPTENANEYRNGGVSDYNINDEISHRNNNNNDDKHNDDLEDKEAIEYSVNNDSDYSDEALDSPGRLANKANYYTNTLNKIILALETPRYKSTPGNPTPTGNLPTANQETESKNETDTKTNHETLKQLLNLDKNTISTIEKKQIKEEIVLAKDLILVKTKECAMLREKYETLEISFGSLQYIYDDLVIEKTKSDFASTQKIKYLNKVVEKKENTIKERDADINDLKRQLGYANSKSENLQKTIDNLNMQLSKMKDKKNDLKNISSTHIKTFSNISSFAGVDNSKTTKTLVNSNNNYNNSNIQRKGTKNLFSNWFELLLEISNFQIQIPASQSQNNSKLNKNNVFSLTPCNTVNNSDTELDLELDINQIASRFMQQIYTNKTNELINHDPNPKHDMSNNVEESNDEVLIANKFVGDIYDKYTKIEEVVDYKSIDNELAKQFVDQIFEEMYSEDLNKRLKFAAKSLTRSITQEMSFYPSMPKSTTILENESTLVEMNVIKKQILDLKKVINHKEEIIMQLKQESSHLSNEKNEDSASTQNEEKHENIEKLKRKCTILETDLYEMSNLPDKCKELININKDLEKDIENYKSKFDIASADLDTLNTNLKLSNERLEKLKAENKSLKKLIKNGNIETNTQDSIQNKNCKECKALSDMFSDLNKNLDEKLNIANESLTELKESYMLQTISIGFVNELYLICKNKEFEDEKAKLREDLNQSKVDNENCIINQNLKKEFLADQINYTNTKELEFPTFTSFEQIKLLSRQYVDDIYTKALLHNNNSNFYFTNKQDKIDELEQADKLIAKNFIEHLFYDVMN